MRRNVLRLSRKFSTRLSYCLLNGACDPGPFQSTEFVTSAKGLLAGPNILGKSPVSRLRAVREEGHSLRMPKNESTSSSAGDNPAKHVDVHGGATTTSIAATGEGELNRGRVLKCGRSQIGKLCETDCRSRESFRHAPALLDGTSVLAAFTGGSQGARSITSRPTPLQPPAPRRR